MIAKPRVLLVQRIVPHYRIRLFEVLANSSCFDLNVAYGDGSPDNSLQSHTDVEFFPKLHLQNFFLGTGGSLSVIFCYKAGK